MCSDIVHHILPYSWYIQSMTHNVVPSKQNNTFLSNILNFNFKKIIIIFHCKLLICLKFCKIKHFYTNHISLYIYITKYVCIMSLLYN